MEIQKAVLKNWSLFPPTVKLVVFTDSEYWKERCNEVNVTWSSSFEYFFNNVSRIEQIQIIFHFSFQW